MDYERTSAPHDSPPPPAASPIDWLLRLRLRAGGGATASVLVGAGTAALVYAILSALFGALGLETSGGNGWLVPSPGKASIVVLFLSDAAGGLAVGMMARRRTLLIAGLTGVVLRLPRLFAALHAPASLLLIISSDPGVTFGNLLLNGIGLVVLSVGLWLLASAVGEAVATRRLDGLGLR